MNQIIHNGMREAKTVKRNLWTEEERKLLCERRKQGVTVRAIAEEMGRQCTAVENQVRKLRRTKAHVPQPGRVAARRWTQEELDRARAMRAEGLTYGKIGAVLGRTCSAVTGRLSATRKTLILNQTRLFTPAEDEELRRLCGTSTRFKDIHKAMPERSYQALIGRARKLGIISSPRPYSPWTPAEVDLLRSLSLRRLPWSEFPARFPGRTASAVWNRAHRL